MKAFTIDAENNIKVHASRAHALETGDGVFTNEEQLGLIIGQDSKRLIAIWNSLTGVAQFKKFTSSKIAVKRIFAAIQKLEPAPMAAGAPPEPDVTPEVTVAKKNATRAKKAPKSAVTPAGSGPRESSKTAQLIEMLKRAGGATLDQICNEFGRQQHTTRAMMSAGGALTKKHGLVVTSEKIGDGRVYSIKV